MPVFSRKLRQAVAGCLAFVSACLVSVTSGATEVERSGLSFGVSMGVGGVTSESGGFAAAMRLGYAVSGTIVLQGIYQGIFFSPSMTQGESSKSLSSFEVYALGAQLLLLPRFWVRPEAALAQAEAVRYAPVTYDVSHERDVHPALGLSLGVDAVTFKHGALEVALSNWGFSREGRLSYAGEALVGFSYY